MFLCFLVEVSIPDKAHPDRAVRVLAIDIVDNLENGVFAFFDPGSHRAGAIHDEHQIQGERIEEEVGVCRQDLQICVYSGELLR
jgi:hypothetical protein